ncbi:hypothetical protein [Micromonospora sp. LOL_024]|uniref:hypothetical protein n=1 Tax=Micromonospora sp. LOL_024 TaxID=3345412 RepID=UPI003A8967FD
MSARVGQEHANLGVLDPPEPSRERIAHSGQDLPPPGRVYAVAPKLSINVALDVW